MGAHLLPLTWTESVELASITPVARVQDSWGRSEGFWELAEMQSSLA